jgi:hypothetical protein
MENLFSVDSEVAIAILQCGFSLSSVLPEVTTASPSDSETLFVDIEFTVPMPTASRESGTLEP